MFGVTVARVLSQRTISVDDIDDTWEESSVVYEASEFECDERGEFGGLGWMLVGCRMVESALLKGTQAFNPVASAVAILTRVNN